MAALKFDVDKGWAWAVCVAGFFIGMLTGGTIKAQGLLFIAYLELFDQGEETTGWIAFARGISVTVTAIVGGYVADILRHPHKRLALVVCFSLVVLTFALCGYMPNLQLTIIVFVFVGMAMGLADPISMSMISIYFVKWRTVAFGLFMIGVGFGGIVFPLIFEACSEFFGFRGTVLILAGCWMHAIFMPAVTWTLPNSPTDLVNNISIEHDVGTNLKSTPIQDEDASYHISEIESGNSLPNVLQERPHTDESLQATVHDVKQSTKEPGCGRNCHKICGILENYRKFLRNPRIPFLLLSCEFAFITYIGGYFLIPPVAGEFGLSGSDVSYIFMAASVLDMALKIPVGLLVDKVGIPKEAVFLVSMGSYGVGVLALSFVSNPYVLYGHALLTGGFAGNTMQLVIPLFVDAVDVSQKGTASACMSLLGGIASAITPVILAAVKTRFGSYVRSLQATAIAAFLSVLFFLGNFLMSRIKKCVSSRAYDISRECK